MGPLDLELSVRCILEGAHARPVGEDSLVECKATWPEVDGVAVRLSAMENAARGAPIVLLIGVRNDGTICGCAPMDLASWLSRLEARFDEVAPRSTADVQVAFPAGTVHAIAFETAAAPYVVRGEGPRSDRLLVQVRRGSRVVDVHRRELLRMVMPHSRAPTIELLDALLFLPKNEFSLHQRGTAVVRTTLFVATADERPVSFPSHRVRGSLAIGGKDVELPSGSWLQNPNSSQHTDGDGAVIRGAGSVFLDVVGRYEDPESPAEARFVASFEAAGGREWRIDLLLGPRMKYHDHCDLAWARSKTPCMLP